MTNIAQRVLHHGWAARVIWTVCGFHDVALLDESGEHKVAGALDSSVRFGADPDGCPHAYLAEDGQWFYTTSGEQIGYRDGRSIYSPTGALIGTVDDQDKWISACSGESLGYLVPVKG